MGNESGPTYEGGSEIKLPQEIKVEDPHIKEPPPTPAPVIIGTDLLTGSDIKAYAALCHVVQPLKARVEDYGWYFKWYEDAEKAQQIDHKYRDEVQGIKTSQELESLYAGNPAPDKTEILNPPQVNEFYVSPEQVFADVGVPENKYKIHPDTGYFTKTTLVSSSFSWKKEQYIPIQENIKAVLERDGVWQVALPGEKPNGIDVLSIYPDKRSGKTLLEELGVSPETIQEIKQKYEQEKAEVKNRNLQLYREWADKIKDDPNFKYLTKKMQGELGSNYPSSDEFRVGWAKANNLRLAAEKGEILVNLSFNFRTMGSTGQANMWVLMPDGTSRVPDTTEYRKNYLEEGTKLWRIVGPKELVITWNKENTGSDHSFAINKLPTEGPTDNQIEAAKVIKMKIAEVWKDRVGMSGKKSPPVSTGWWQ